MTKVTILAAVLASATALAPVAYAASNTSDMSKTDSATNHATASKGTNRAEDKTLDRDFTKLSKEGFNAFRDLRLARLAIFDGHTDQATTLVKQAQGSLDKASKDDTAFMKAASDINPPKQMQQDAQKRSTDKTPVKWLPIDGQVALTEGYKVTPDTTAAIGKANQSLKSGDRKSAIDTLKLAGIDMNYVMALTPLEKTSKAVDQASGDLANGKYYEANLDLKKVEDGVVYDSIDVVGNPAAMTKTSDATPKSDQGAKTAMNDKAAGASSNKTASPQSPKTD